MCNCTDWPHNDRAGTRAIEGWQNMWTATSTPAFPVSEQEIEQLFHLPEDREISTRNWYKSCWSERLFLSVELFDVLSVRFLYFVIDSWPSRARLDITFDVTVLALYSHCTCTVLALYSHCTHTVLALYSHCTRTVLAMCSHCTRTVLALCSHFSCFQECSFIPKDQCWETLQVLQLPFCGFM